MRVVAAGPPVDEHERGRGRAGPVGDPSMWLPSRLQAAQVDRRAAIGSNQGSEALQVVPPAWEAERDRRAEADQLEAQSAASEPAPGVQDPPGRRRLASQLRGNAVRAGPPKGDRPDEPRSSRPPVARTRSRRFTRRAHFRLSMGTDRFTDKLLVRAGRTGPLPKSSPASVVMRSQAKTLGRAHGQPRSFAARIQGTPSGYLR